jgi:hypothetical protein
LHINELLVQLLLEAIVLGHEMLHLLTFSLTLDCLSLVDVIGIMGVLTFRGRTGNTGLRRLMAQALVY